MTKETKPFDRFMDKMWGRDKHNQIYTGEALMLALLLKVKRGKTRTEEQEKELREILDK